MNRRQLTSVAIGAAMGLLSSLTLAHDGDRKTTAEHARDFMVSSAADATPSTAGERPARTKTVESRKAGSQWRFADPFELNVPGRPEFGRVGSS